MQVNTTKKSAICTLFEGHYHYGLAALVNSLHKQDFRGSFFVGYRGDLPAWSGSAVIDTTIPWVNGCYTYKVAEGLDIHFLLLKTNYHLTNYKAQFILELWKGPAKNADAIVYFDPDIVIKCRWAFFENWMSHGISLVHEIVSNDMPVTHPIRLEWEKIITESNRAPLRKLQSYINGGFCGVTKDNIEFVETWSDIIDIAVNKYKADPTKFSSFDRTYPFWSIDQDAINIAAMCCTSPISELGPEGMDFIYGGWTMSHATGTPKPWKKVFLWSSLKANPPSLADKAYWLNVKGPITVFNSIKISLKQISISISSFIGRFYHR